MQYFHHQTFAIKQQQAFPASTMQTKNYMRYNKSFIFAVSLIKCITAQGDITVFIYLNVWQERIIKRKIDENGIWIKLLRYTMQFVVFLNMNILWAWFMNGQLRLINKSTTLPRASQAHVLPSLFMWKRK